MLETPHMTFSGASAVMAAIDSVESLTTARDAFMALEGLIDNEKLDQPPAWIDREQLCALLRVLNARLYDDIKAALEAARAVRQTV